jgi:hypothetical protein
MAESGRNCVECGGPVAMFSGITIDGAAYHTRCWEQMLLARSTVPPYTRPRVMPVVEPPQLGHTRF